MELIPNDPLLEFHPDTMEVVRKMNNLDNGRMEQSLDLLEEWVKKQNHFLKKEFNKKYYEQTLISCKGSIERAKSQIDKMCTYKTLLPKYFICRDLKEKISLIKDLIYCVVLPKMTTEHQRVYLLKIFDGPFAPESFSCYYRLNIMITEYLKLHDYNDGYILVDDIREANLVDLLKTINLVELQQFMTILTEGYGAKLKGIHIISQSKFVDMFARLLRSVVPPKIGNRIYIHQQMDDLYEVVDKELFPKDYGGSEMLLKELRDKWINVLCSEEHQKYLEDMIEARTDESLRQTDKFNDQYMGVPGSFRALAVD